MNLNFRSNYESFPREWGNKTGTIEMYIDNFVLLQENDMTPDALAIMVEPRAIYPDIYDWLERNYQRFKYVFTFDSKLLELPNAKLLIYGQITDEYPDQKTKDISMVASNKDFCDGHKNRQRVARALHKEIDTYGRFDGGDFCSARDFLSGYRFSVAMENFYDGYYFTEKICNCFASKIVPIYLGCPHIGEFFDERGIVICNSPDDVINKTRQILLDPVHEYNVRKNFIENNFKTVQKYRSYSKLFLETYGQLLEELV